MFGRKKDRDSETIKDLGPCSICGAPAGEECVSDRSGAPMGDFVHAYGNRHLDRDGDRRRKERE
jgi:hypothetical protein